MKSRSRPTSEKPPPASAVALSLQHQEQKMNRVHSRQGALIPVASDLAVIAELQALALAIRIVGLENLDSAVTRKRDEAEVGVNQKQGHHP